MNAKKLLALSLACTLTLGLSACGGGQDAPSSSSPSGASDGDALKVGIILSTGGLGDKNFNDMTYAGAQQAEKDFGIEFDYVETQSASDFLPNYRMFAESGEYDLIIGLAADQTEAINEISIDFPEQKISHIDSSTDLPNVSAVYTKWQEQTFLTGVVAGLGTLSGMDKANSENVVGVILGQDQPTLRMGVVGFEAGVRYVNPDCEVLEAVVGDFNDPAKAKEIALNHAGVKAADAIFVKAGLDWDDGRTEYEVEFYAGNTEYDYSIDATTGAIRSYDHDWDDFSLWNPGNNAANPSTPGTSTNNLISEAKAKEIALAKAPSGASVVRCHLDWDDGRYIYEIKMVSGTMEYECDINAATGVITDWDVDSIYD